MKVLLTGAFGNVGFYTLQELICQEQEVRCFGGVKSSKKQEKVQQLTGKTAGKIEIIWGDLRQQDDVAAAMEGCEVVVHLGFIIPPAVDKDPETAYAVNVGGTRNVLEAAKKQKNPPRLLFASTFDVYGRTQDQEPPRKVTDPVAPVDDYSKHKVACEVMVQDSGLDWAIFRLSDIPPIQAPPSPQPIMFTIPLDQRHEMLHPADAALAIANGLHSPIWGKIWLIGGGPRCQIRYRDYVQTMMERMRIGKLPEEAFTSESFFSDWLDTSESQALLQYQRHSFEEIVNELAAAASPGPFVLHVVLPVIRPLVRRSILKMSPYLRQ